jgi:hypothetical protein
MEAFQSENIKHELGVTAIIQTVVCPLSVGYIIISENLLLFLFNLNA